MGDIELAAGGLRAVVAPGLGGSLRSLTLAGESLLRPTRDGADDVLETACFPLVPYANRIAHGRAGFGGREIRLAPNMGDHPHPLHGDGWLAVWQVERADAVSAALTFSAEGSAWPWAYAARQTIRLDPAGIELALEVTNLDAAAGPFGIGFHPYFPDAGEARLTAATSGVWLVDDGLLPIDWVAGQPLAPWRDGAAVARGSLIDHCHTGWTGPARIDLGPGRPSLSLAASPELAWLHIYAPPGGGFFCVEPVSHAPNALNMPDPAAHGVCTLQFGESLRGWMRLDVM